MKESQKKKKRERGGSRNETKKEREACRREETIAAPIARQPHYQIENVYSGLEAASAYPHKSCDRSQKRRRKDFLEKFR